MPLDYSQRLARARNVRKYRKKMSIARERLSKRLANPEQLDKRARRMAVKMVRKIVAGRVGLEYDKLSVAQKMEIDKKVANKKSLIDRFAKRLLPKVRQKDKERLNSRQKNESVLMDIEMDFVCESTGYPLDDDMQRFVKGLIDSMIAFYGREEALKRLEKATLPQPTRDFANQYVDDYEG